MLLVVVVAFLAMLTLGGLGNAAYKIEGIYWVPFILDIPFFAYIIVRLWKEREKEGK